MQQQDEEFSIHTKDSTQNAYNYIALLSAKCNRYDLLNWCRITAIKLQLLNLMRKTENSSDVQIQIPKHTASVS